MPKRLGVEDFVIKNVDTATDITTFVKDFSELLSERNLEYIDELHEIGLTVEFSPDCKKYFIGKNTIRQTFTVTRMVITLIIPSVDLLALGGTF